MCGKNFSEAMLNIDISVNIFNDPTIKMKVLFILALNQIIIEYNSEIFQNLTSLLLQFKDIFSYSDLYKSPNVYGNNTFRKSLKKRIECQTPLYVLRKHLLKKSLKVKDEAIKNYQIKHYM